MKIFSLFVASFLVVSSGFAALSDFAGKYTGKTLTTFTETSPPTYNEAVTVSVKAKGKGNAGSVIITSQNTLPGNEKMIIVAKLARSGSGSALVNNPGAGVANLTIPWNAKIRGSKYSVASSFLLFGVYPTNIALTMKVHGKKLVGLITCTRLDTGEQVVTSNFAVKRKK